MPVNKQYFLPLVEEFCKKAVDLGAESYPPHGLFVPYTFEKYEEAPIKIFYVGRDTYGWISFKEMMQDFKNGELGNYLQKNSNVVTVRGRNQVDADEHSLKEGWNKNNRWSFWTFCQKLHLYITMHKKDVDLRELTDADYQSIEQMAYGNLNSIEHDRTLQKMGNMARIADISKFQLLRDESRKIDRLRHIIEAYSPDLIIVLNWEERDDVFEGLEYRWEEQWYEDKLRAVYNIAGYKTKVLWSLHPAHFSYESINPCDMIEYLGNTARELLAL